MNRKVRVRFAPSPTGPLHIGGLRTALYNFLFAKQNQGDFILRIEDTDQNRFVPGAESYITNALSWCGIEPDESPLKGGDFKPYRQSERMSVYAKYAGQLVESGNAYYAFDTVDDLETARKTSDLEGATFQYNAVTRENMRNSLKNSEETTNKWIQDGLPYVIRLKVPANETVILDDMIRGEVKVSSGEIDDKVLLKSDGMPTYHLANVVDDYLMEISHVIRGEEWLPSAPLHVLLYRFLGFENQMPQFAHLPLLLKPDGKGKLSKRDGIKFGFPVFPMEWVDPNSGEVLKGFKESGYLPEAFINFLVLLGWNPGTEQEIFDMDNLIKEFSIERIGKAGAKFDIEKAIWFNQQYIRIKPTNFLVEFLKKDLSEHGINTTEDKIVKVTEVMKERITYPNDLWNQGRFFFIRPDYFDFTIVSKKWTSEVSSILSEYSNDLKKCASISPEEAKETLSKILELRSMGMGKVMQPLRVFLTGEAGGPDLMTIINILGPVESSSRIDSGIKGLEESIT